MTPYSQDLRERVVETIQRGDGSVCQIASRFLVSVSFVTRLLQLHRTTGSVEPRPHGGGNPAVLGPEDLQRLRELIRQAARCHARGMPPAARRLVQPDDHLACPEQAGAAAQEEDAPAEEQDRPEVQEKRREFRERLAGVDPGRLVFVDECGANTAMTRAYGRAPWDSASTPRRRGTGSRSR